jgi:hypothetical protein
MDNSTTKLTIFKALNKAFTTELVDKFYSISLRDKEISLQGRFSQISINNINSTIGTTSNDWNVKDSGYIEINLKEDFLIVDGKQIKIEITLT